MGGTTTKVGVIVDGESVMTKTDFFGIPLEVPWTLLRSAALGGGSVARVSEGQVALGPDSMGAYPGPACYDLGGDDATLTDALLVAGMLNPDRFLGGRRQLSVEQAREALDEHVASPLDVGVEEAARLVIKAGVAIIEDTIRGVLDEAGYGDEGLHLSCFGGNGANLAAPTADRFGIAEAYVFQFGPVLSAFGSAVSDISHVHEEWPFLDLSDDAEGQVWELAEAGRRRVLQDLEGEGLSADDADLSVEVTVTGGEQTRNWTVEMQQEKLQDALSEARSANGGVVERVAVRGVSPAPRVNLEASDEQRYEAEPYDQRTVLGEQASLYDWEDITPGAAITGPAVLESATNTCTVPADWELQVDGFGNAVLHRRDG